MSTDQDRQPVVAVVPGAPFDVEDGASTFHCVSLSHLESARVADCLQSMGIMSAAMLAAEMSLKGWKNVKEPNGERELPWDGECTARENMDRLPWESVERIGREVIKRTALGRADRKNS